MTVPSDTGKEYEGGNSHDNGQKYKDHGSEEKGSNDREEGEDEEDEESGDDGKGDKSKNGNRHDNSGSLGPHDTDEEAVTTPIDPITTTATAMAMAGSESEIVERPQSTAMPSSITLRNDEAMEGPMMIMKVHVAIEESRSAMIRTLARSMKDMGLCMKWILRADRDKSLGKGKSLEEQEEGRSIFIRTGIRLKRQRRQTTHIINITHIHIIMDTALVWCLEPTHTIIQANSRGNICDK
ncbi:hypothetical protein BGW38_009427 [Lunasporangiospora selenospora]|uniref:Uncharacterized protein n=1 Tax=Lunasporangiospora selenospora TaxID=979761 RepID=A0A9P6FX26_9FUNG|nr:hypothetical protein BGW38_009427 [Lunasporangiospora selenospora]